MIPAPGVRFLLSAQSPPDADLVPEPSRLLLQRMAAHPFRVAEIRLDELDQWTLGDTLVHDTGRYFTIEGLSIRTNFGAIPSWDQPIINQPEIGILGFLAQERNGVLHLLAQAKMEPGNSPMVQFTPTVQATPSNYTRVHGGKQTPYLEYFIGDQRGAVLVDTLQSEQGARYYRKRNRNMIVEVPPSLELPVGEDFAWLNLRQLRELHAAGNSINMNSRTVLSCISYDGETPTGDPDGDFREAVLHSRLAPLADDDVEQAMTWLIDRKSAYHLDVRRVPLGALRGWTSDVLSIRHDAGRYFRIIGASVEAGSREVTRWTQPMFAPQHGGCVAFLCQRREGVLQFLVQARLEVGIIDNMEIAPTLQFSLGNYGAHLPLPPLAEYLSCQPEWIRFRAHQSEDGGRFYHDQTEHIVIEVPPDERLPVPENYRWATLGLLERIMRRGYKVNVEARSLMACLG